MPDNNLEQRVRRALSYRQKARSLKEDCARALASGDMDAQRHASVSAFYARHLEAAEAQVAQLREDLRRKAQTLAQKQADLEVERHQLVRRAATGRLSARDANESNRALTAQIAQVEREIEASDALRLAETPDDLGGLVDLPLDQYDQMEQTGPTEDKARFSWGRVFLLVGLGAAAILVALVLPRLGPGGESVSFEANVAGPATGIVQVTCRNDGSAPAALHVPWSQGMPYVEPGTRAAANYGVTVYLRDRAEDRYRLFPASEGCWTCRGRPIHTDNVCEVGPGLAVALTFDMRKVRNVVGAEPQFVKLVFSNAEGHTVKEFEAAVPRGPGPRLAPPPSRPARPEPTRPTPERGQSTVPSRTPPAAQETAPEPTSLALRFVGMMGNKVALTITRGQAERAERVAVEIGQEVADQWLLEAVVVSPSAIVVRHQPTGRVRTIPRGERQALDTPAPTTGAVAE